LSFLSGVRGGETMSRDSAALKPLVPAPASSPTPLLTFQVKCSGPLPGRHAALSRLAHREAAERRVRIIAFMDRTDRALGLTRRTLFCAAL
jgi:hypothetical protein